jgi:hypothetical protein
MPSSPNPADGWNDHRLREIVAVALSLSAVLEDPSNALLFAGDAKPFLADVGLLGEWLAPCEEWSADARTRPQGLNPAILDALFALWKAWQRLDLSQLPAAVAGHCVDHTYPKKLRALFQEAAHHLRNLVRREASQAEDGEASPCLVIKAGEARAAKDEKREDRDGWLYEKCRQLVPYKAILGELNKIARENGWDPVTSIQAIRQAAQRYAERHRLPPPPARQESL